MFAAVMLKQLGKMLGNEVDAAEEAPKNAALRANAAPEKARIVLAMIVKDEADVIEDTLGGALPLLDAAVVLDTGSSDQTPNIARRVLGNGNIPFEVHTHEWEGYSASRNRALGLARALAEFCKVGHGWGDSRATYLFVLDAGERVEVTEPVFLHAGFDAYKVSLLHGGSRLWQFRLFRADVPFEYVGEIHETATPGRPHTEGKLTSLVLHERTKKSVHPLEQLERYTNDAIKFEALVEREPDNARAWFYLAQSYRDSLQIEKAIKAYEHRATMGGYAEEVFWSLVEIGRKLDSPLGRDLAEVRVALLRAYEARPTRAEPIYTLGWLCRQKGLYAEAEMCQRQAAATPDPVGDALFVEVEIYTWLAKFELSINCYWTGKYGECVRLSRALLEDRRTPDWPRAQMAENMRLAIIKLAEMGRTAAELSELMGIMGMVTPGGP